MMGASRAPQPRCGVRRTRAVDEMFMSSMVVRAPARRQGRAPTHRVGKYLPCPFPDRARSGRVAVLGRERGARGLAPPAPQELIAPLVGSRERAAGMVHDVEDEAADRGSDTR